MKDKIKNWLSEQGYPLEFRVANYLRKNGFNTIQSDYYQDSNTRQNREIDVVAYKQINTPKLLIRITLVVECKSGRNKPWLLFSSPFNTLTGGRNVILNPSTSIGRIILYETEIYSRFKNLDIFTMDDKTSFGITQCFTNGKDIPYNALTSLAKATASIIDKESNTTDINICDIFFPFLVIEAPLYESFYKEDIEIEKVESGTITWRNRIVDQQETIFRIQRIEHFEKKIESYSKDIDKIIDYLKNNIKQIQKLIDKTKNKHEIR